MWKSHGSYLRREWQCRSYEGHCPGVLQQSLKGLEPFRGTAPMFVPNPDKCIQMFLELDQTLFSASMELTCIPGHSSHSFLYAHFTSSWGKTSQTGQVSESLESTWQLCAVGHGSHSPRAAPEHVRQAAAKPDVEITQRISRLVVKEGRRVARWFLGNFTHLARPTDSAQKLRTCSEKVERCQHPSRKLSSSNRYFLPAGKQETVSRTR